MNRCRIYCNSCLNYTWHEIVAHVQQEREDDLICALQTFQGEILRCCGCDMLAFRLVTHPFSFQDEADKPLEELFPERGYKKRDQKYFSTMPAAVRTLHHETVAAHESKLDILSAVGLRALLEAIIVDKIESTKYGYSLESKINALNQAFKPKVLETLHNFRIVGNEAVYGQVAPDNLDIHRALYVVESIMEYYYGIVENTESYQNHMKKTNATTKRKPKDGV